MRAMFEAAVALAVSCDIRRSPLADGKCGRGPNIACLVVAHIKHFAGRVTDGVVRPGRDLVLLTVERPGETPAFGGNLKTERRIGDDVDPRCRCAVRPFEDCHIFASLRAEAAEPVEEFEYRPWQR